MQGRQLQILEVNSSGRKGDSVSRKLSEELLMALENQHVQVNRTHRDLSDGVPFVNDAWIEANFTPEENRSEPHREILAHSDTLVGELQEADILVIGVPVYNFSIAAALKAWIDMIARARLTFAYTENGPKGLLTGKKAYLVVASGGVSVGSAMDFATPYLKHALGFIGITDVEVIAADGLNSNPDESIERARAQIAELTQLTPKAA